MTTTSRVNWRLEGSDEEGHDGHESEAAVRKRSSRACDQCRKSKSKCERSPDSTTCKNCAAAGVACTFEGPSYKRGPPKGYINAIEHRWHMVESLLGAIVSSPDPRCQSIVSDLRRDELAKDILERVQSGPFGPAGREKQKSDASKEDFFVSFFAGEASSARDRSRPRRQSRVSREIVSSREESTKLPVPTMDWQDKLSHRLAAPASHGHTSFGLTSAVFPDRSKYDQSGRPVSQRRRTNGSVGEGGDWRGYAHDNLTDSDSDSIDSETENQSFGQLSLDENSEARFPGRPSGLHVLAKTEREDDRTEGGIWRFPMMGIWPPARNQILSYQDEEFVDVNMPDPALQDRLVELYFAYVHPAFPVVHKRQFLRLYQERRVTGFDIIPPQGPQRSQTLSKVLLLVMFSIATRYIDGAGNEDTCPYAQSARLIIDKVYHHSRPSTCQVLLLLGVRAFGIGSFEQGWLYIGMAIRMAQDLGLNRDPDKFQYHGGDMFALEEKQFRKTIWWSCCLVDKYSCVFMGRPPMINSADFDTPLPDVDEEGDSEEWRRLEPGDAPNEYLPVPGRQQSYFRAVTGLSVIVGNILQKMYSIRLKSRNKLRAKLLDLERSMDQWFYNLPECLRYDSASASRPPPPPYILHLHVYYNSARLLLYSPLLPPVDEIATGHLAADSRDTLSLRIFDQCQSAACTISSLVTTFHKWFNLKYSSPIFTHHSFAAGNMHIVTLKLRPNNPQASLGYEQVIRASRSIAQTWSSAQRVLDLLNSVRLQYERVTGNLINPPPRQKRSADEGGEKSSDLLQRRAFGTSPEPEPEEAPEVSRRILANMLGLDVPGIEPSTSFFPGYEWWPRSPSTSSRSLETSWSRASNTPSSSAPPPVPSVQTHPRIVDWQQGYPENLSLPSSDPRARPPP
ncbi:hypothetical protein GLOTRDRAFT_134976 [Gloeophyllum trabeum ATCC 11539]|uniref:Zn(2)-C6 fungal-type domain-containing protein n=1 Tax=Gloeophyllum trabeum (strain ATCC 11539 / FP-39264 / Madison 617) TaxID=670483 RepID=S7QKH4_GLOTA|nr:uncharacterized protein GLOTRDRAFT_134976 [Gloeophyllum trabeum ATCC 11539]EPQ60261.1 hypothetical protein GLOTRDRAFT_134976 [Gloeophyllum trabeum ATCC 11539]